MPPRMGLLAPNDMSMATQIEQQQQLIYLLLVAWSELSTRQAGATPVASMRPFFTGHD
jgi:hypothetical protein